MIRRPPRSTLDRSSAASDVYKRQPYIIPSIFLLKLHHLLLVQSTTLFFLLLTACITSSFHHSLFAFLLPTLAHPHTSFALLTIASRFILFQLVHIQLIYLRAFLHTYPYYLAH